MKTEHTLDWSDRAIAVLHQICHDHAWDPLHLLGVMQSESGCRANAYNPNGGACGLVQFMPQTRKNLGWTGSTESFLQLGPDGQLPFVRRYFAQYATKWLNSPERFYVACFLPSLLWKDESKNQDFVLCAMGGPLEWAYTANKVLDVNNDDAITVGDLAAAIRRACKGARWEELKARVLAFDVGLPKNEPDAVTPVDVRVDAEPHETAPRLQDEFGHIDEDPDDAA